VQQAADASSAAWEGIATCSATTGTDLHVACVWRAAADIMKGGRVVSQFMRYTCQAEVLPVVEGALAANGYTMDLSLAPHFSAATALVMRCGTTIVLLAHAPNSTVDDIEVWGAGQSATANLFESLPIELHKQPPLRSALRSP
jgi:hypothetical protein